jgi:hypothetical protein
MAIKRTQPIKPGSGKVTTMPIKPGIKKTQPIKTGKKPVRPGDKLNPLPTVGGNSKAAKEKKLQEIKRQMDQAKKTGKGPKAIGGKRIKRGM